MTVYKPILPKPNLLRWEIAVALLIKIVLLVGLWFLIFRWPQQPAEKPDIGSHFALPAVTSSSVSMLPQKEVSHVR